MSATCLIDIYTMAKLCHTQPKLLHLYLEAVWLKNVRCKALETVVFFRLSSLNSATIRLEAAKKSNRFKSFSLGHFLQNSFLINTGKQNCLPACFNAYL